MGRLSIQPAARVVNATLGAATTANAMLAAYLGLITIAGARRDRAPTPPAGATTRFAIMVPAHDEEAVIENALAAFRRLDYDRDRFEVHVVADNCTDRTAEIVRASGFQVHERHVPGDPGKGPALNWLFDRLDRERDHPFDVGVVVDADSVVDPGFLRAMDHAFTGGAVAAQGFYSVQDPGSSPSAGLRFAALACRHHLRPLGRCRLGASAGLYGNGMAFDWEVLRHRRWTGHLVEDAEYQMELLVRDGVLVTYVPAARLEAEMPATFDAATSQNARWERGRIEIAKRYLPALATGIRRAPANRRVAFVDAIADHLVPPLSVLAALQLLALAGDGLAATIGSQPARRRALIDALAIATVGSHVVIGLWSVRAPSSVYRNLARLPMMIVWKLRVWIGAVGPAKEVAWQRTQRNATSSSTPSAGSAAHPR